MIPKECKRLAEVDFPIAAVSRHAVREKSIRHGHPSTLHLWWARRPLASSRAVLMALLLPDPCDLHCPESFKREARRVLLALPGRPEGWERAIKPDAGLRQIILQFIADFANWDRAAKPSYLDASRALVKAAHGEEAPLVVDPFAGGGSIPLEALRLGCEAFASDLNPVACLILKVMLEEIPRHGPELAEELRKAGSEIKERAKRALADLYPRDLDLPEPQSGTHFVYVLQCSDASFYIGQTKNISRQMKQHEAGRVSPPAKPLPIELVHWEAWDSPKAAVAREKELNTKDGRRWIKDQYEAGKLAAQLSGATPIVYLWARTVRCEAPNCGAEIPLMRSFWLCKKSRSERALRHRVERSPGHPPRLEFELFTPKEEKEVQDGTVAHAKARCLCCGAVLPPARVRAQLVAQKGGADAIFDERGRRTGGACMMAVVTLKLGKKGRHYRLPTDADYAAVCKAQERVTQILKDWERTDKQDLCPVPDEPLPLMSGTFNVPLYGINTWGDLFTARQKIALVVLTRLIQQANISDSLRALGTCALNVFMRACNGNARLRPDSSVAPAFGMHALPITWTFPETVISGGRSEHFDGALSNVIKVIEQFPQFQKGQVQQADATNHPLPDQSAGVWFTDPPYYFAVPYADLSDFFFVWLKRTIPDHPILQNLHDPKNALTPKEAELCEMARWDPTRYSYKDQQFFENGMMAAFTEGRRVLREDGIGSVVFAHKTTEGWEALLSGMIRGGWTVTGSWPIATEKASRLRARNSAALATSVHLICRPRAENAVVGDWAEILQELPKRVADWMEHLQREGVRGADLIFACIGPALEIYSRYSAVETAAGSSVGLPEYLKKVWEVVGRAALHQVLGTAEARARNGLAGALEEDARLTALFLWTLQSTEILKENSEENGNDEEEDEREVAKAASKGLCLPFDVVRRFAQPMGIDLDVWTDRIISQEKGVVRLLSVAERAKELFGEEGANVAANWIDNDSSASLQGTLFAELDTPPQPGKRRRGQSAFLDGDAELQTIDATTLDRVHAAMLLQASGHANALRRLIGAQQDRGPDFLRLANALSALYPSRGREKQLLDAMLLVVSN